MTVSDAWIDFLAGWCSGAAAVVVLQPVDTVLTRLQAGALVSGGVSSTAATPAATTASSSSASSAATSVSARATTRTFLETRGWTALWRGASPMIASVPVQNSLLMGGYGVGEKYAEQYNYDTSTAVFVGGCTGGILQSFLMSPVELVKVSQQCELAAVAGGGGGTTTAVTAAAAVRQLLNSPSSAWKRGLGATLLRDGLPHGVWFWAYAKGKEQLGSYYASTRATTTDSSDSSDTALAEPSVQEQVMVPLLAGAWAATAAWTVGYPADLIKTRIQAGSNAGIVGTARQLVADAGGNVVLGLYRGFGLKLVRSVPASMIGFTVYELVKKQIETNL